MIALINRNLFFYLGYLLLLILALICLQVFSKEQLFLFFNANRYAAVDYFFYICSCLGDGLFFAVICLVLLFISYRYALASILAFALSSLIAQSLKHFVFYGEPRPLAYFKGIGEVYTVPGVELHSINSFPSGHTTTAFAIACLLSLTSRHKGWSALFLIIALCTGFSRMYLGQHFFADVTAGSFIGVFAATVCFYWMTLLKQDWADQKLFGKALR